jgi:hypothetical protein
MKGVHTPFLQFFNQLTYATLKYDICAGEKKKKTLESFFAGFIPLCLSLLTLKF